MSFDLELDRFMMWLKSLVRTAHESQAPMDQRTHHFILQELQVQMSDAIV